MELSKYKSKIPANIYKKLESRIKTLRPAQHKAIDAGIYRRDKYL